MIGHGSELTQKGRRRLSGSRARTRFLVLFLFLASAAITWQFARRPSISSPISPSPTPALLPAQTAEAPAAGAKAGTVASNSGRPVYLHSVIPGGVQSAEELREAAERDPVVAQHFKDFDYQHARLLRVSENEKMYVAYRIGDKIYWTRKKIAMQTGETLISDGKIVARTRCGNRVAAARLGPAAVWEAPESDLNRPLIANDMVTNEVAPQADPYPAVLPDAAKAVKAASHKKRLLPLFFLPLAAVPGGGGHHEPLAVAPEPGTMLLLGSGLAGVYWKSRKARRKR